MSLEKKLRDALSSSDYVKVEEVFEEIYYEYYNLVCFCIYRYNKNNQDIEDLANDVFDNFYKSICKKEITNIKSYLVASSKNAAINKIRYDIKHKEILDNDITIDYEDEEESDFINELEKKLPKDDFYILYEHIVNERTFSTIAKDLNISVSAARKRYQRIVKKLRGERND